jgi:hypothetical protein
LSLAEVAVFPDNFVRVEHVEVVDDAEDGFPDPDYFIRVRIKKIQVSRLRLKLREKWSHQHHAPPKSTFFGARMRRLANVSRTYGPFDGDFSELGVGASHNLRAPGSTDAGSRIQLVRRWADLHSANSPSSPNGCAPTTNHHLHHERQFATRQILELPVSSSYALPSSLLVDLLLLALAVWLSGAHGQLLQSHSGCASISSCFRVSSAQKSVTSIKFFAWSLVLIDIVSSYFWIASRDNRRSLPRQIRNATSVRVSFGLLARSIQPAVSELH